MYRLLAIACVFAIAGGYLDAYSYLEHGHVFANAQTGNVILFGVFASGEDWQQALRHLPPITGFVLGVAAASLLGVRPKAYSLRATLCCQGLELATLIALGLWESRLPNSYVVPIIAFVAAVQNSSFNKIGSWSFNSAMTTGNLREAASGLIAWISGQDREHSREQAVTFGLICVSFLCGALFGGLISRSAQSLHLLPCAGIVAVGMLMTVRERKNIAWKR